MIRPLCDLHRRTFTVLALLLPALIAAAILLRDPESTKPVTPPRGELVKSYHLMRYPVEAQIRRQGNKRILAFSQGDIREPDVLLYVAGPSQDLNAAKYVGQFRRGESLDLPDDTPATMKLTFYSGARQQVLEEVVMETGL